MTRQEVLGFFEREGDEEYPCVIEWTGGEKEPGLLSCLRAESSDGLPVLVVRDPTPPLKNLTEFSRGEVTIGPGDLSTARRGAAVKVLRPCDGDDSPEAARAMEGAARAGFEIALR
jgi:hypothetical protein